MRSTGGKPPRSWGVRALQAGQAAFLEEQGKRKQTARASGLPFEPAIFDSEAWWEENWRLAEWEVPSDAAAHPVVYVTYPDAQRYARWAGLRLMTEFEFQRAARGDSTRTYPWGEAWDDARYCRSLHSGADLPARVGSFPDGAAEGFHDLVGNVWEWTSSPFEAFPGYQALTFNRGRRTIESLAPFDPEQRVIVSGSFHTDQIGVRIATRRYSDRTQSTNALGFRCAASPTPGLDAANALIEQALRSAVLADVPLAPERTVIHRHWRTVPGRADVPGYAVIAGYEHVLFCPRTELPATTAEGLTNLTLASGPVFLGFVDLPRASTHPALAAGTYFVAWRGAGEPEKNAREPAPRTGGAMERPSLSYFAVPGFSTASACYVLYGSDGEPRVAVAAPAPRIERMGLGSLELVPSTAPDPRHDAVGDTLRFTIPVASSVTRSKGLVFELALQVAPATASRE